MKFIIDRTKWLRGRGVYNSFLWASDIESHNMCCLGQISEQCGIDKEYLEYKKVPSIIDPQERDKFDIHFPYDIIIPIRDQEEDNAVSILMAINDTQTITDAQREMMLTDLVFYFFGHELEFIN